MESYHTAHYPVPQVKVMVRPYDHRIGEILGRYTGEQRGIYYSRLDSFPS